MDALNELKLHNARKQSLQNIPSRISELEQEMAAIRSATSDSTPVKGGGSGRENMMLNNIVRRDKLQKSLDDTMEAVGRVDGALAALKEDDRKILEYFFISPRKGAVAQLATELGIEEKTVYNRRNDAILAFKTAMYGDIL